MTHDELVEALTVERYDHRWWRTPPPQVEVPEPAVVAERRRVLYSVQEGAA